jgi:hypothetical protein
MVSLLFLTLVSGNGLCMTHSADFHIILVQQSQENLFQAKPWQEHLLQPPVS